MVVAACVCLRGCDMFGMVLMRSLVAVFFGNRGSFSTVVYGAFLHLGGGRGKLVFFCQTIFDERIEPLLDLIYNQMLP